MDNTKYTSEKFMKLVMTKNDGQAGCILSCLKFHHSGGRGRCILLNWMPAWSMQRVPGQPDLYSKTEPPLKVNQTNTKDWKNWEVFTEASIRNYTFTPVVFIFQKSALP